MLASVSSAGGKATISLKGRFDFTTQRAFRQCYVLALEAGDVLELEIDLGAVEALDSSALGMLLVLREKAQAANKTVSLANCRGAVRQTLDLANFSNLFAID